MHTWDWQTEPQPSGNQQDEQPPSYLTCSLLQGWQHGFFTRHWGRSPTELVDVLQPTAQVYRIKQVHGNGVLSAAEIETAAADNVEQATFPDADGVFSDRPHQATWVCSADCTPALIADVETGQVAAVHAGWRGTALKILPKAIARLQAQGSQLQHLRIALGPAIAGEVYQVSKTVAAQVGSTILTEPLQTDAPEGVVHVLEQLPHSPILPDAHPGRARLDVRRVNQLQLEQLGISPEQIAIAPYCTYQSPDLFFSYRRSQQKQVQWSGIVSRSGSGIYLRAQSAGQGET
ncbi:MAG: peptidoglycan editing factor PgeF [Oscillatoriophycideae cyanobacterium NC_groundwater_1537_Pr4_S-0.65um_50_18]|nr:peptidoglycan editing factor PgeF [Oscillatoriophycideae cyanobacterium NC_groundwater_1537_Pr4_S-0.65um_50_18]